MDWAAVPGEMAVWHWRWINTVSNSDVVSVGPLGLDRAVRSLHRCGCKALGLLLGLNCPQFRWTGGWLEGLR